MCRDVISNHHFLERDKQFWNIAGTVPRRREVAALCATHNGLGKNCQCSTKVTGRAALSKIRVEEIK